MLTPYQFASNSPISGIDLDGLEYKNANDKWVEDTYGGSYTHIIDDVWVYGRVEQNQSVFYTNANGHWAKIQSRDRRFSSYRHLQTGTGHGLSVNQNFISSNYTDPIIDFAVGSMGSALIGAIGLPTLLESLGSAYVQKVAVNYAYEIGASLMFNHDLSGVDHFDALNPIPGKLGKVADAALNFDHGKGTLEFNSIKGFLIEMTLNRYTEKLQKRIEAFGKKLVDKSSDLGNYSTIYSEAVSTRTGTTLRERTSAKEQAKSDYGVGSSLRKNAEKLIRGGSEVTEGFIKGLIGG